MPSSSAAWKTFWRSTHAPSTPRRPLVCMDESSKQLLTETRTPLAPQPGQLQRYDYEYSRNGVATLFVAFEPLAGWRHVEVTQRPRAHAPGGPRPGAPACDSFRVPRPGP